jgi:hypothetical protein
MYLAGRCVREYVQGAAGGRIKWFVGSWLGFCDLRLLLAERLGAG